jgi:hypothetical protein
VWSSQYDVWRMGVVSIRSKLGPYGPPGLEYIAEEPSREARSARICFRESWPQVMGSIAKPLVIIGTDLICVWFSTTAPPHLFLFFHSKKSR